MAEMMTEARRAALARQRGELASKIADPEKRREYITRQGELESRDKGTRDIDREIRLSTLEKETAQEEALGKPGNYVSREELHVPRGVSSGRSHAGERVPYKTAVTWGEGPEGERSEVRSVATGEHAPNDDRDPNPVERTRQKNNRARDMRTNLGRGKAGIVEVEGE